MANRKSRGAPRRARRDEGSQLERRRAQMQAAEGHAGSIPRGNQQPEHQSVGQHRDEYERVLGH
jgi:hypothetical protein